MRMITGTRWPVEAAQEYIEDRVMIVPWSGCWLWEPSLDRHGYGRAVVRLAHAAGSVLRGAHRLSYEAFTGPIPDELCVLHRCDVPCCCCPDHLFLGTKADNNADMAAKGRASGGRFGYAKLTEASVREALRLLASGLSQRSVGARLGVNRSTISGIATGRSWRHVPRSETSTKRSRV